MAETEKNNNKERPQLTVDVASDEPQSEVQAASSFVVPEPDVPATETSDDEEQPASVDDEHPTLGEVVARRATEEDKSPRPGLTLNDILGGEILNTSTVRKQIWLILLISAFAIVYISNRYSFQQNQIKLSELRNDLQEIRYRQRAVSSELTELTRKSKVLDMLKQCQDSTLHTSNEPPYKINIPTNE